MLVSEAQRRAHQLAQDLEIDRLGNEIKGSRLQRLDRGFHVTVRGDDGGGYVGVVLLDVAYQVDAVAVRQAHIRKAKIEPVFFQQLARIGEIERRPGIDIHLREGELQQFADIGLVINNQCGLPRHLITMGPGGFGPCVVLPDHCNEWGRGKRNRKQLPPRGCAM